MTTCSWPRCEQETHQHYPHCEKHTRWWLIKGFKERKYMSNTIERNLDGPVRDTAFDFRFSASYASRYNNCHGSANLEQALPGFVHPERNERGMKGEGTRLHEIFQEALSADVDIRLAADLLEELSKVWGPKRTELLQDEKKYIMWWFMGLKRKSVPPVEWTVLNKNLIVYTPIKDTEQITLQSVPPRRILFIAEALRYVAAILDTMENPTILVEVKREASWLETKPKTTVDLIISDGKVMHVLDLKMGDLEVSPITNEQLMYYAKTFLGNEERIFLHIMQRNNMASWELPMTHLNAWTQGVQNSETEILAGDLSLSPGSHCTFCPANPVGRGDKGTVFCPAMMQIAWGTRDEEASDAAVLEGDIDD